MAFQSSAIEAILLASQDAELADVDSAVASDIKRGDIVVLKDTDELGVVRELLFIDEKEDANDLHVRPTSTTTTKFGVESFAFEKGTERVEQTTDGCIDGVRYFNTRFGAARVRSLSQIAKVEPKTLLEVIASNKSNISVTNFYGASELDEEQYLVEIRTGDVILSENQLGLIDSTFVDDRGEKVFVGYFGVSDDRDGIVNDFEVRRRNIQRKYNSEELFEVIRGLFNPLMNGTVPKSFEIRQTSVQICGDEFEMMDRNTKQTFIICPSYSLNPEMLTLIQAIFKYEARSYPLVMHLANANVRMIFLSSQNINQSVLNYYLSLNPRADQTDMRRRLRFFSVDDDSNIDLSQKVLSRPRLIKRIQKLLKREFACDEAHLMVFIKGDCEQRLSEKLGVPLYGPTKSAEVYGTKAGSRIVFRDARIPHCVGTYKPIFNREDLAQDIWELLCREQTRKTGDVIETIADLSPEHLPLRLVLKINSGFSGDGNAILHVPILMKKCLEELETKEADFKDVVVSLFATNMIEFQDSSMIWDVYYQWIETLGCIIEVWMEDVIASPSCSGFIHRSYARIYATHDQILKGQVYLGCRFPCEEKYRKLVQDYGQRIASDLMKKGALENFSVDFVVTESEYGMLSAYAVEINLRWGGTTHPMRILRILTNGRYHEETGNVVLPNGETRCYVCMDNVQNERYIGLLPDDVLDEILQRHDLHWNPMENCGIVLHMLNALSMSGKCGVTCIARTFEEAGRYLKEFKRLLDRLVDE